VLRHRLECLFTSTLLPDMTNGTAVLVSGKVLSFIQPTGNPASRFVKQSRSVASLQVADAGGQFHTFEIDVGGYMGYVKKADQDALATGSVVSVRGTLNGKSSMAGAFLTVSTRPKLNG